MRLHELSVTAFGPFVETVRVDFDELAASGLFLLTGDTGAGKTSVLDAVCFALYGEVPGDRHGARHLRSDQADPQTEPRVVLRVSIGRRTFRFTRSPAWERPKRRGTGTTRVQAHVVVEELREDGWVGLTNRLDEAGQLVSGLLGMTCTQFTQVAMLPQGRFQAFLRASSAERHAVLQRLFRTRRFEEVERWLVDRRSELRRRSQVRHERCAGVVNRLQEAAGVGVPDTWDLHDLDEVADDGSLAAWSAELLRGAVAASAEAAQSYAETVSRLEHHREACERGRSVSDARDRGRRARETLARLESTADDERLLLESVDDHRRAVSVLPAAARVDRAQEAMSAAAQAAAQEVSAVAGLLGLPAHEVRPAELSSAATRASEARAVAESWLPRETELHDERARRTTLAARRSRLEAELALAEEEQVTVASRRERVAPVLAETSAVAARMELAEAAVERAETGLAAAGQVARLVEELQEAADRLREATQRAQDLREHYLDLRERRISGMAAELAVGLAAGCSCPVCGSAEHPSPALASAPVSRLDEDKAREAHETADFSRQALQESHAAVRARLDVARTRSDGRDQEQWGEELREARAGLDQVRAAVQSLPTLTAEVAELDERERRLGNAQAASRATLEAVAAQHAAAHARCELLATELDELLSSHPEASSVAGLVERHIEMVTLFETACAVLTEHERATDEQCRARADAQAAAASAGFSSVEDALGAVLPSGEAAARAAELDSRRSSRAAATEVLDDPDVCSALEEEEPDLPALTDAVHHAEAAREHAHAVHQHAAARRSRLESLVKELTRELEAWAPVRREHDLAARLASLAEGRSADNQLKMRLSAYVLSERLAQVVAAANERLGEMTDLRYALEQADQRGAGEQRGGLSLRVRDEWSGKQRDPATLSGGETFLVSLALALGLADTVSHEAGGTQLETLFIDEGFGALDPHTLDGVMDTLDSLRDGGRVVGVVSHVPELRNRVPAQLEVLKGRHGSTLRTSVANN